MVGSGRVTGKPDRTRFSAYQGSPPDQRGNVWIGDHPGAILQNTRTTQAEELL